MQPTYGYTNKIYHFSFVFHDTSTWDTIVCNIDVFSRARLEITRRQTQINYILRYVLKAKERDKKLKYEIYFFSAHVMGQINISSVNQIEYVKKIIN